MADVGDQREIFGRRLVLAAALLGLVVFVGAGGYHLLGDGRWSTENVFYFTVITLSTVGFGETLPGMDHVPYARLWTIGLIFFGSGTLLYFISNLTAFVVEGDIEGVYRRRRMQNRISNLEGHYIVCGIGSTGVHVVEELIKTRQSFVVIDRDRERLEQLAAQLKPHTFLYVHGDATEDAILRSANIMTAKGVIAALTDDKDNLYITLSAYQLVRSPAEGEDPHPDPSAFRIVAKAIDPTAEPKLRAAGATRVVSPSKIGGMRMVSEMVRPTVVEFLDTMLRDPKKHLRIEEVPIPTDSSLIGAKLRDTEIRVRTNAMVIAVKHAGAPARYTYNPGPDLVIEDGMVLIVLAETAEMGRLRAGIDNGEIGRVGRG